MLRPVIEQVELRFWFFLPLGATPKDFRFGKARFPLCVQFGRLEIGQYLPSAIDDIDRQPGKTSDLNPVALIRGARLNFSKKYDLIVPFPDRHIIVLDPSA